MVSFGGLNRVSHSLSRTRAGWSALAGALVLALAGCGAGAAGRAGGAGPSSSAPVGSPSLSDSMRPSPSGGPLGFVPVAFTAVSASNWWVLGRVPCGVRYCSSIRRTTDGGNTFRTLPAPGGSYGPDLGSRPPVSDIRFADPKDGWVFGPSLYATHDGGLHWAAVSVPGTVSELEPGLGEVFAVVSPPPQSCAQTGTCDGGTPAPHIYRAEPGSDHWTLDSAGGSVSEGLAVHGRSVWIIDSMVTVDGPAIGTALLHSTDSGDHFTPEAQPIGGIACNYSPASDTVIWSYCSGGHFDVAARSVDAGAHFEKIGPEQGTDAPTPNDYPNGSTLKAASPTTAVAAIDISNATVRGLIRTTDAGATWTIVQAPLDDTGTWTVLGFTTAQDGYALWGHPGGGTSYRGEAAQLWRTTNSGANWTPINDVH